MTRHYRKPPIIEAVVSLGLVPKPGIDVAYIEKSIQSLKADFEEARELHSFSGEFKFDVKSGGVQSNAKKIGAEGFMLQSKSKGLVLQIKPNELTINCLGHYDGWESYLSQISKYWDFYKKSFQPQSISRVGIRYINKIVLESERLELNDYFIGLPEQIYDGAVTTSVLMRKQLYFAKTNLIANITFATNDSAPKGKSEFILDIDVISKETLPTESDKLSALMDTIRVVRDSIFEKSLTEKTKALFDPEP